MDLAISILNLVFLSGPRPDYGLCPNSLGFQWPHWIFYTWQKSNPRSWTGTLYILALLRLANSMELNWQKKLLYIIHWKLLHKLNLSIYSRPIKIIYAIICCHNLQLKPIYQRLNSLNHYKLVFIILCMLHITVYSMIRTIRFIKNLSNILKRSQIFYKYENGLCMQPRCWFWSNLLHQFSGKFELPLTLRIKKHNTCCP